MGLTLQKPPAEMRFGFSNNVCFNCHKKIRDNHKRLGTSVWRLTQFTEGMKRLEDYVCSLPCLYEWLGEMKDTSAWENRD